MITHRKSVKSIEDTYRINAAIVAFNRPDSVIKLINSLLNQSHTLNKIIIVDNSTNNMVKTKIRSGYPKLIYKKMGTNTGSAGGYYEAFRLALDDSDFIWLFDDDVSIKPDATIEMLKWLSRLNKKGNLGALRAWAGNVDLIKPKRIKEFAWRGTMIASNVVKALGYPDPNFFLYGEDVDYSIRMNNAGYLMYYTPKQTMLVKGKESKDYLFLFNKKIEFHSTPFRLFYAVRNELILYRKHQMYKRWFKCLGYSLKLLIVILLFKRTLKIDFIQALLTGIIHGITGKMGMNNCFLVENQSYVK